jgi:hypothetical protein
MTKERATEVIKALHHIHAAKQKLDSKTQSSNQSKEVLNRDMRIS